MLCNILDKIYYFNAISVPQNMFLQVLGENLRPVLEIHAFLNSPS